MKGMIGPSKVGQAQQGIAGSVGQVGLGCWIGKSRTRQDKKGKGRVGPS